jgi:streptogramin lyase
LKRKTVLAILLLGVIIVASFSFYEIFYANGNACQPIPAGSMVRSQTAKVQFGAVTEYKLPGVDRWPNAVTTAPDGSVWFAEQEVPGVAHFFPNNGTVVEYAWPGYQTPKSPACLPQPNSSGIALWNGRVWASDQYGHSIVGINPIDGTAVSINTTGKADIPYWLAVGPDGSLWYTSVNTPAKLGRVNLGMTVDTISLAGLGHDEPIQLDFVNSSFALLSTINESGNKTVSCFCDGHIYAFDPSTTSSTITPTLVGGGFKLVLPISLSYSGGSIWATQHGASSVVRYDFSMKSWTKYPTSTLPWLQTTLPYVVDSSQGNVWFNEHYANRIAVLDPGSGTLTEYSESDPPASNYTEIQNDLSISAVDGGLWFTSMSGNYVGFVNASYTTGIHLSVSGTRAIAIHPGGNASFTVTVSGALSTPMKVTVSDSESFTSIPNLIQMTPSVSAIPIGSSTYSLGLRIVADQKTQAGNYTVGVTVTNGLIQQTAYFFVDVK